MEIEYTPEQIAKSVSATYDVIDNIFTIINLWGYFLRVRNW